MATTSVPPVLEMTRNEIDVTSGGWLGGRRDSMRQFAYGPWRFYIDGVEVGEDQYRAEEAKWREPHLIG